MSLANKNLFSEKLHQKYIGILDKNIPEISLCNHENFYSLIDYYISSPAKFFNQKASIVFFDYLNSLLNDSNESRLLIESLNVNFYDLDQAIKGIDEINIKHIHEKVLSDQEVESMYEVSNVFLYEYLRSNDLILMGLIKPIAYFLRRKTNKGIEKLDIFNCIETLQTKKEFEFLGAIYNHSIRNAIAHGSVAFAGRTITFKNRKDEVSYSTGEFVRKFDEFIDLVNGITHAYRKFYLLNLNILEAKNVLIPNSIKINELKTKSEHFGWKILYNYDSTLQLKRQQCNLFVSTSLNSRDFMNLSAYQTAIYLERLLPEVYDTVFIQIKTKFKMSCWQSFDMHKLRNFINNGVQDIVTDGTYFFDEKVLAKKKDYLKIYRNLFFGNSVNYGNLIEDRYIKFHSKKSYNVIEKCSVVLDTDEMDDVKSFIRSNTKKLLKRAVNSKNKKSAFFSKNHFLPTKYIRVVIYSNNMRERAFQNSSFSDKNIIAILHYNGSRQIQNILPAFGVNEDNKHCTICWSKNHPIINEVESNNSKNY